MGAALAHFSLRKLLPLVGMLVVGLVVGYGIAKISLQSVTDASSALRNRGSYTYINPLLACDAATNEDTEVYSGLSAKIQNLVAAATKRGDIKSAGIYFRDLHDGRWIGEAEEAHYAPASLFKIPVMIAYLKQAETRPTVLTKTLIFSGQPGQQTSQNIIPQEQLENGKAYSVEELMRRMIVYSDNDAELLLIDAISQKYLNQVFTDLDLDPLALKTGEDSMSAKSFSLFLRVLYNGTYLSAEMSERALELLAEGSFNEGLVAALPSGTVVAHKFGERSFVSSTGTFISSELHDCGIIYKQNHPYLLCVMTAGTDFNKLKAFISSISRVAYQAVR